MTASTTTIRVNEPRELLALIPYQLGFIPTDSLVAVSLTEPRGRVGLIVRVDLAGAQESAAALAGHLAADGAARAVIVTYTDDPAAARAATAALTGALADAGILDSGNGNWTVTSTGYRSMECQDLTCCPEPGRPLSDLDGTQVAATMTYAGTSVLPARADLAVTPAPEPEQRAATRAAIAWLCTHAAHEPQARTAGLAAWQDATAHTGPVPADLLGIISAALTDVKTRDAILVGLIPNTPADLPAKILTGDGEDAVSGALGKIIDTTAGVRPGDVADQAVPLLSDVAAHAGTSPRAAAPLTLLALIAWWSGDGARASVLVTQALTADPTHRLAILLDQMTSNGLPPGWARRTA
jgi:hypothetical protein